VKTTRAYIASISTTGVMVASSILLLVVVSALVAFRGWPGDGVVNGIGGLVLDRGEPSLKLPGPAQIALDAAPAASAVAPAPPPAPAAPATGGPGPAPAPPPNGGAPTPPSPGAPGAGSQPVAAPVSTGGGGGPSVPAVPVDPEDVGNTTQNLTQQVGGTVGGVNPQLGQGVTDTGKALSEIVKGLPVP
jgi:hypothetical protein